MPMYAATGVLQDLQRLVDEPEPHQQVVEQAVVLEDADPGVDADQERRPRRQHHQHHGERDLQHDQERDREEQQHPQ
jgi:hypothetical protein